MVIFLTKKKIDGLSCPTGKQQEFFWDERLKGFGLKICADYDVMDKSDSNVTRRGKKTFLYRYVIFENGRKKDYRKVIGEYGKITLEQARNIANIELSKVLQGVNVVEEKRKSIQEKPTFKELTEEYFEKNIKVTLRSTDNIKKIRSQLDRFLIPVLGKKMMDEITKKDCEKSLNGALGSNKNQNTNYNRVRSTLCTLFNHALREELVQRNPVTLIPQRNEETRARWANEIELKRIYRSILVERDVISAFFSLFLFTGCRKTELRTLKWENVDDFCQSFTIPKTKNGLPHTVFLGDTGARILKSIHQDKNPYVFYGTNKGKAFHGEEKAWKRIKKRANVPDLWIHDLRRSVGSHLASQEVSYKLIKAVLNHADSKDVTHIYTRLDDRAKRTAFLKLESLILEIVDDNTNSITSEPEIQQKVSL